MNVVFLSFNDWCGAAGHLWKAISPYCNSNHIVYHNVNKGYVREYCIAIDGWKTPQKIVDAADVLIFVGDEPISLEWKWPNSNITINIPKSVPKVLCVVGSYFRRSNDIRISCPIATEERIMEFTDLRFAMSPDLNYPWFKSEFLPVAYDCEAYKNVWKYDGGTFKISHSPTVRNKKGTQSIIDAVQILKNKKYDVEFDIIENVSWQESLDRKKKSHLFVSDLCGEFWGYSAVEAMSFGVPTINNVNPDFTDPYQELKNHPLIRCGEDSHRLSELISNLIVDRSLPSISEDTKRFVDNIHSYESVGKRLYAKISHLGPV